MVTTIKRNGAFMWTPMLARYRRHCGLGVVAVLAVSLFVALQMVAQNLAHIDQGSADRVDPAVASLMAAVQEEQASAQVLSRLDTIYGKITAQAELTAALKESLVDTRRKLEEASAALETERVRSQKLTEALSNVKVTADKFNVQAAEPQRRIYPSFPATSVWCYGDTQRDRICRFRNLYYHPQHEAFFAVITDRSILHNVPENRSLALMDLTSIDDHSAFYFHYQEVSHDFFRDSLVSFIGRRTYLMARFHVGNIMHTLHDDFLGLYWLMRQFSPTTTDKNQPTFANFRTDHYIQFYDEMPEGDYAHLFRLLSDYPLRTRQTLCADKARVTMFEDVVVGQTKQLSWYQYGFTQPQGPIKDKAVSGHHVRQAADYIRYKLGIFDPVDEFESVAPPDRMVILSRSENRLILNEQELRESMSTTFATPVDIVRMKDLSFAELVAKLSRAKAAVGMHGSMLILAMFMPKQSALVELFPYAVPSDNYTPYRTMARLPGMQLQYRAWENQREEDTVTHADYPAALGGLAHLSATERKRVQEARTVQPHLCCTDPYWLYRIYQDTRVNVDQVVALIKDALDTGKAEEAPSAPARTLYPAKIVATTIQCKLVTAGTNFVGLLVEWEAPWNGVSVDYYSVWEHLSYTEYVARNGTSIMLSHPRITWDTRPQLWVRWVKNGIEGPFSDKKECTIPPTAP